MKPVTSALILLLTCLLVLPLLAACGKGGDTAVTNAATQTAAETEPARIYIDDIPDDLDLGGKTFKVLWYNKDDYAEEETGEVVNDAMFARNLSVETRLNCKIVNLNEPYSWNTREEYLNKIRSCVLAHDGAYDIASGQYATLPALVAEGDFLDLTKLPYLDFTKNYWVQQLIEETTIGGRLYLASGDITNKLANGMHCVIVNKTLMENLKLTDPTESVYAGKWTIDAMNKMIEVAYADLNGDGKSDLTDRFGAVIPTSNQITPFVQAFDIPITTMDKNGNPVLSFGTERVVKAAEAAHALVVDNKAVFYGNSAESPNVFLSGRALFYLYYITAIKDFVEMEDELGLLPYPKLDEAQEDYGVALGESNTLFGILPSTDDKNAAAAVFEALAAEGKRLVTPALYEVTLKTRYATDPAFAEMTDFIHDRVIFNFGSIYGYGLNEINTFFKNKVAAATLTWSSSYDAMKDAGQKAIDAFIETVGKLEQ